jgi:hypothetical protein
MSQEVEIPIYSREELESKLKELNRALRQLSKPLVKLKNQSSKILNAIENNIRRFGARIDYEKYFYSIVRHVSSIEDIVDNFVAELVNNVLKPHRESSYKGLEWMDGELVRELGEVVIRETNKRAKIYTNGAEIFYREI